VTTRTDELSSATKATHASTSEALNRAEQLLEAVRDKVESAAMHGWHGVAATMEAAGEHLEGVAGQLGSACQALEAVTGSLDEITEQTSGPTSLNA
jgi:hypothetical protein